MSKKLLESDYRWAAAELMVDLPAVKAVVDVESNGKGFYDSGTPTILFERHVMFKLVSEALGPDAANRYYKMYPELCNPKPGGYGPSEDQPSRMGLAANLISRNCALQAASWGLFQIMGYHWKSLGFFTLQAFVNAMYASAGAQLQAFVSFVQNDEDMYQALKTHDWKDFARRYNGPAYKKNRYDEKLEAAYKKHGGII
jgi:hypothetical protein